MSFLNANSLASLKLAAADSFNVDRFRKRTKSKAAGDFSTAKTFTDGALFDGRMKVATPEEVPVQFAGDRRLKARLTCPAGEVTLAEADRVKDTFDNAEFEVLSELGTRSADAVVWEWLIARV